MTKYFLDFASVRREEKTFAELIGGLTKTDLRELTTSMVDAMLDQLADCIDADVIFLPKDPRAHDENAAESSEENLVWTLGHVIVHTTATADETAFLAAELARGVPHHGRSRYETPWEKITTIEQCRQRLEESRRMRLASLEMWPDEPHLEVAHVPYPAVGSLNAIWYFTMGLMHDDDHLEQITKIVQKAKPVRS